MYLVITDASSVYNINNIDSVSYKIYYNFGYGLFLTLGQLYKLKQDERCENKDLKLEMQSPNGKICKIKLKSYPWPLTDNPQDIHLTQDDDDDGEYYPYPWPWSHSRNTIAGTNLIVQTSSDNQIFYQNARFRKNIFRKKHLTKRTLTNFTLAKCLSVRQIKYYESKFDNVINTWEMVNMVNGKLN